MLIIERLKYREENTIGLAIKSLFSYENEF